MLLCYPQSGNNIEDEKKRKHAKLFDIGRLTLSSLPLGTSRWNGKHVTTLWSTIWPKLDQFLRTKTKCVGNDKVSKDKSRKGQISWRSCYNKMQAQGLFASNKIAKSGERINVINVVIILN